MSKGEQTRTLIINTALEEAAVSGVHGLSIGGLAERLQMSKSGLFGHFGSKEALQRAVMQALLERFTTQVIYPALKVKDGVERMQALFDNFMSWMTHRDHPGGCPVIALSFELDARPGPLRDFIADQQRQWMDVIERIARKCVNEGGFRADLDVKQFSFEFEGIAFSLDFCQQLLNDSNAEIKARRAFERLIDDARA